MALTKITGPGQRADIGRTAAAQRADYVRALEEERRGYEVRGLKDRIAQVDAELARVQKVKDRTTEPQQNASADHVPPRTAEAVDPAKKTAAAPRPARKRAAPKKKA